MSRSKYRNSFNILIADRLKFNFTIFKHSSKQSLRLPCVLGRSKKKSGRLWTRKIFEKYEIILNDLPKYINIFEKK